MKLSDYAKESIVEAIRERFNEAREDLKKKEDRDFSRGVKEGYYEALLEVLEVIENRKDW